MFEAMNLDDEVTLYRNPIVDADVPDPDVIRVGERFYLVASSFHRAPGLPILASDDLINWERVGYALESSEPTAWFALPRHGGGVWAPSIRHHDGRFVIVYPDPDQGILVVTAEDPAGPWSPPHVLLPGLGLIDPCPLWDDDGSAYLVHGWARSRAGKKNVVSVVPVDAALQHPIGPSVDVIDGDDLAGFTTLEGPKFYKRDGEYWIFAPAGGVATGWQTVFRADSPYGPYEHRIVLAQGDTPVNGPHQGAWVTDLDGRDWFLHFQDRGVYGRVLHLQPMTWDADGWPLMGQAVDGGAAQPVLQHPAPHGARQGSRTLARSDDFVDGAPSIHWQWEATPDPQAIAGRSPGLVLRGSPDDGNVRTMPRVLSQPLPGWDCSASVELALDSAEPGARAGLAVLGLGYAWAGIRRTEHGTFAVVAVRDRDEEVERVIARIPLSSPAVHVEVAMDAHARARFALTAAGTTVEVDPQFTAVEAHWLGASLSLFAAQRRGATETEARFERFAVELGERAS